MANTIQNNSTNTFKRDKPLISIIVATSLNNAIGRNNQLLWHISEDLKYFKKVTTGHTVIMGRKTWESIGRPLPNRRNIVISHSLNIIGDAQVYSSLKNAITATTDEQEVFIIGGGELYKQTLPIANKLYLTIVAQMIDNADTFFPEIDFEQWIELESETLDYGQRMLLVRK